MMRTQWIVGLCFLMTATGYADVDSTEMPRGEIEVPSFLKGSPDPEDVALALGIEVDMAQDLIQGPELSRSDVLQTFKNLKQLERYQRELRELDHKVARPLERRLASLVEQMSALLALAEAKPRLYAKHAVRLKILFQEVKLAQEELRESIQILLDEDDRILVLFHLVSRYTTSEVKSRFTREWIQEKQDVMTYSDGGEMQATRKAAFALFSQTVFVIADTSRTEKIAQVETAVFGLESEWDGYEDRFSNIKKLMVANARSQLKRRSTTSLSYSEMITRLEDVRPRAKWHRSRIARLKSWEKKWSVARENKDRGRSAKYQKKIDSLVKKMIQEGYSLDL